jgi:hypothetical protein
MELAAEYIRSLEPFNQAETGISSAPDRMTPEVSGVGVCRLRVRMLQEVGGW